MREKLELTQKKLDDLLLFLTSFHNQEEALAGLNKIKESLDDIQETVADTLKHSKIRRK